MSTTDYYGGAYGYAGYTAPLVSTPARPHARWTFVVVPAPTTSAEPVELSRANGRKLTFRLMDASDAGFTINARTEQAEAIEELASDLKCWRNGDLLFRGRFGATQDQISPDNHTLDATAVDYRGLLERRITYADETLAYDQADQEAIAWQLIANTQARTGGNLGITRRTGQTTGVLRDRTYEAGKPVGEAIQQLSELDDGFDWTITPELEFQVHYPSRGFSSPMVLEYGGAVRSVARSVDPSGFANAWRVSGAEGADAVTVESADLATDPRGRFDRQAGFPDVSEPSTLQAKADYLLARHEQLTAAYAVELAPQAWAGPDDLWLGDVAMVVIRSGRLNVIEAQRVYEIGVDVSADGSETVRVTLGRTDPLSPGRRERHVEQRLTALERR